MLGKTVARLLADAAAPNAEPHPKRMIKIALLVDAPMTPLEPSAISLALSLAGAAAMASLLGSGEALALAAAALPCVFGWRAVACVQAQRVDRERMNQ